MSFGEESSSHNFPIAISGSEFDSRLANPSPPARNRAQIHIGEAPSLRPDSGVHNTDDYIGSIIRFGPETLLVSEAEELRRAGGVEVAAAVLEGGEDGGVPENGGGLRWSE